MNEFKFDDFDIDFRNPLGVGAFSAVYKATKKNSNEVYAIKRISIENINENEILKIINMNLLNECENSIKYFGYFKEENLIYLIMEFCDCNLYQIINKKN